MRLAVLLSPARISRPMAPWAGAGGKRSGSRYAVMSACRPNRLRPATASSVASATPSASLRRRVSTLPRKGTIVRSGRARSICEARRSEDEPSLAPCGSSSSDLTVSETKASRISSRSRKTASNSPSGSFVAMSLLEWTPISTSPASSAASISLENSPLPPISLSGASVSLSPDVVMVRISIASSGTPWASREQSLHQPRLDEGEVGAARADA